MMMPAPANFFGQLGEVLFRGPVALATVVAARGSTPRIQGARQFFGANGEALGSIGGGATEGQVSQLALATLSDGRMRTFEADLRGSEEDLRNGICGGVMTVWIHRLTFENAADAVTRFHETLRDGRSVVVRTHRREDAPLSCHSAEHLGRQPFSQLEDESFTEKVEPAPRLLVCGAGHIGRCLARLADASGFSVMVHDDRRDWLAPDVFSNRVSLSAECVSAVNGLIAWQGGRYAALVTRGMVQDLEALTHLARVNGLDYVGVLGSERRVRSVLSTLRGSLGSCGFEKVLHAPIGVEIGAETPEEIAVSIVAEMIKVRRGDREAALRKM